MNDYDRIIKKLIEFRNERDWEQFHDSRNLALALMLEAAELNELFLWKKKTRSGKLIWSASRKNWPTFLPTPSSWHTNTTWTSLRS